MEVPRLQCAVAIIGAGRIHARPGDFHSEGLLEPLDIKLIVGRGLENHLPQFLGVGGLGKLEAEAGRDDAEALHSGDGGLVDVVGDFALVGLDDDFHEVGGGFLLGAVAVFGVLTKDGSKVEQGDLLVAGGDEVLVNIAVGGAGLGKLKFFLGVDDEVGGGTDFAHHGLCAVEHVGVLRVGLQDAGRYAVDFAKFAPA